MNTRSVSDTWERGSPYEQYIGRWSRRVAPLFLSWLDLEPDKIWLDVGCGTGALCAAIFDLCAPADVIGVEPSEGFLKLASQNLAGGATLHVGSAAAIPLSASSVDAVVSGLVLNFVPDVPAALAEMRRVSKPGGAIAAYVWDYEDQMDLIRIFWDAAVALDEGARQLHEGFRFPICSSAALRAAFEGAGLSNIEVTALNAVADFASFEEYWRPFLGGQGPAPAYAMSLAEDQRSRLRDAIRGQLPTEGNGSITLDTRAWGI
ncbi:MAG: methyltransferase domain-containing protein [Pseudomonadota bacterium]